MTSSGLAIRLCLGLALLTTLRLVDAKLPQKIELEGRSFALSADVSIQRPDGDTQGHYAVDELHSHWQERSRVNYRMREGPFAGGLLAEEGSVYSADQQVFVVEGPRGSSVCQRIKVEQLDEALGVDFVRLREAQHHVGTARLLLFVEQMSDKFSAKVAEPRRFLQDLLSTDHYEANLDGGLKVSVIYESKARSLPLGVPSRVLVEMEKKFTMLFRFMRVVQLAEGEPVYASKQAPGARHGLTGLMFDALAVPRNAGCSRDSTSDKDYLGTLAAKESRYRFSFSARLHCSTLSHPIELAVGYEPELQTLRVDRTIESRVTQTLVSYRHDRLYHLYRRRNAQEDFILDSVLRVRDNDQVDDDVSCVVMKTSTGTRLTDTSENPHTLGDMLLGATRVTYLGLARVRGIEAFAFEAHDGRPPVWLEQPSVVGTGNQLHWRANPLATQTFGNLGQVHTTVFYFSRANSDRVGTIRGNRLLLMEVFIKTHSGYLVESMTIPIFDFTWQLKSQAPNGQRTEDFFSLGDECLGAATSENHFARISLRLTGTEAAESASAVAKITTTTASAAAASRVWLSTPVARNLALMRAVSEQMGVPPTLVYDLGSRYQAGRGTDPPARSDSMGVSMMAAERPEAPVRLTFLGKAQATRPNLRRAIVFKVFKFQVCYLVASHSRKSTLFTFDDLNSYCTMFHVPESTDPGSLFVMDDAKGAHLEVYRVTHEPDRRLTHDTYLTKLDDLHGRLVSMSRVVLADPTSGVNLADDESAERSLVNFAIGDPQVEHLNERTSYDLEERHLNDVNKFPGLGLVAGEPRNKQVDLSDPARGQLTFERCQGACLADPECRSFSTCVTEGRPECVLSSVDFGAPAIVLQLMLIAGQRARLGAMAPVSLEQTLAEAGANVSLRRHPTCELHNKLYADLFSKGGSYNVNLAGRLLTPVTHREQCARRCYEITLEAMREETARQVGRDRASASVSAEEWTRGYAHNHCSGYFYLDHLTIAQHQLTIAPDQVEGQNGDGATLGYCLFERGLGRFQLMGAKSGGSTDSAAELKPQVVELRQFDMDFGVFYEKRYGVSLAETPKTPQESRAYTHVNYMRELTPEHLELMRAFVGRGGNTGSSGIVKSAAECARLCFTQTTPLWPACRSFEYIELLDRATARRNAYCAFNTLTLREAPEGLMERDGRQSRVKGFANDDVRVWHFEPRLGLVDSALDDTRLVNVERTAREARLSGATARVYLGALGLIFVVTLITVAGALAGAYLSEHLLSGGQSARDQSRPDHDDDDEVLIESSTSIKFEEMDAEKLAARGRENGHL